MDNVEKAGAKGTYLFKCFDSEGNLKWEDTIQNVVCSQGKCTMLDAALAGVTYSVTGPFMGLISGAGSPAPVASDTMGTHGTWTEFTTYLTPTSGGTNVRATCAWNAATGSGTLSNAKTLTAALTFYMTAGGTVFGGFIVFGTGAVSTPANSSGSLWSAGALSGGTKTVNAGDTLQVSYTTSL